MSEKFSDFPLVTSPNPALVKVVGLDELGQNAQFNADEIGGGGGTVQSSSNVGTGEGIALPLSGTNLPFKTLKVAGSAFITSDADSVTVEILPNNTVSLGDFGFDSSTIAADPGSGDFRLSTGAFSTTTTIYLSILNDSAVDVSAIVSTWLAGDKVYIQKDSLASSSVIYTLTGVPVLTGGTYFIIPVIWEGNGGGGFFVDGDICSVGHSPANTLVDHSSLTGRNNAGQHIAAAVAVTASGLLTTQLQTSLEALDSGKAATVHTHTVSSITNLSPNAASLSLPASTTITPYIQTLLASTSNATAQAAIGAAASGTGVPTGGTTGQVLAKIDATNYNTQWVSAGGTGTVTNVAGTAPIVITGTPTATPTVTITAATGAASGSMSAADKAKLDAFTVSSFAAGYLDETNIANTFTAMGVDPDLATLTTVASTNITTQGKEVVGASTPVTARRAISAAVERFAYKASTTTPIFLILTGQSNALGDDATGADFALNANVWDFQITTPAASPTYPTVLNPNTTPFTWRNPNPADAATAYLPVADSAGPPAGSSPYIGYRKGGYGNVGYSLADRLQKETGRDVYVLSVTWGAAAIARWAAGAAGYCRIVLESFCPYIITNYLSALGVTAPDIIVWGQGESDVGIAPLTYKNSWLTMRAAADGLWADTDLTSWYLMEATDYYRATGFGGVGINWEGTRAVNRYTDNHVKVVSATGLPDASTIHFTGTGLNDYGYNRIGDAVFGTNPAMDTISVEVGLDANPILGGNLTATGKTITGATLNTTTLSSDLVAGNNDITGLEAITFTSAATWTSVAPSRVSISGTHTYDFANALISPLVSFGGTHILDQSSSAFGSGLGVTVAPVISNASGETTAFSFFQSFNAGVVFQANGGIVTQAEQYDFNSNPVYNCVGGIGTITCTTLNHYQTLGSILTAGSTVTNRHGFRARALASISGTLVSQSGVTVDNLTQATTGNTHILYGTSTIPSGTYGIYQGNTAANSLNADTTIRSGSLTLTSGNLTLTSGSATLASGNINIPAGNITFNSTSALTAAIEGASFGGFGSLIIRPNHLNATEKFTILSSSNALVLRWTPQTAASGGTLSILNDIKTTASTTGFVMGCNSTATPMTSGNIVEFKSGDASNAIKAAISYKGLPGFFGVTAPAAQTTAGGRVAIGSAGATNTAFRNTTYTGDTGASAYTVGDIVRALKDYGLFAA